MFLAYIPPPPQPRLISSQGKVAELRLELNAGGKKDRGYGVKKIVANMTMSNNDMVSLFPDIIGCMHIQSLEIKKMYGRTTDSSCCADVADGPSQVFPLSCQLRENAARDRSQGYTGARAGVSPPAAHTSPIPSSHNLIAACRTWQIRTP